MANSDKRFIYANDDGGISIVIPADNTDLTLEQISYLWVYQLPFIKIILTGASTISQLQENLNCLNKLNTTIPNLDNLNLSVDDYWSTRKSLSWN